MTERRRVGMLLALIAATGVVDAACLLHLELFTAYITGSLILLGAYLVGVPGSPASSLVAIVAFVGGAALGAALVRRGPPGAPRPTGVALLVVAALAGAAAVAAAVLGIEGSAGFPTIALLGLAMGTQMAVIHRAEVPDVAMPAATLAMYHLVASTQLDEDHRERTGRRAGVVAAIVGGAMVGAALSRWQPWAAWAVAAVVVAVTAVVVLTTTTPHLGDAGPPVP